MLRTQGKTELAQTHSLNGNYARSQPSAFSHSLFVKTRYRFSLTPTIAALVSANTSYFAIVGNPSAAILTPLRAFYGPGAKARARLQRVSRLCVHWLGQGFSPDILAAVEAIRFPKICLGRPVA